MDRTRKRTARAVVGGLMKLAVRGLAVGEGETSSC